MGSVPGGQAILGSAGLADYNSLMRTSSGELLRSDPNDREVRRLALSVDGKSENFYLKKTGREPLTHYLRMLLAGRKPQSSPLREKRLLEIMQRKGFAVMEPVAWGEERAFGLPRSGFLLVREVVGKEVADLFYQVSSVDKNSLLWAVGHLVGRLHASGFYQPVRIKDLICTTGNDFRREKIELVVIDRETGKPWSASFSRQHCARSLARSLRRTLREGYSFGPMSLKAFSAGYLDALSARWLVCRKDLYRQVHIWFRKEAR